MAVTIYHNPGCGTSRNALAMIRKSGEEPTIIEYLKTPPSRDTLVALLAAMKLAPRDNFREKGTPFAELGLGDAILSDDAILDAHLTRGRSSYLTDRYSERIESAEALMKRVNQSAI